MRQIPGFVNYFATEEGVVLSSKNRHHTPKPLRPRRDRFGYATLILRQDGRRFPLKVHRLIVITFLGPIANGLEVNHIDGNKLNNSLSNLEVVTKSQNVKHAYATGLRKIPPGLGGVGEAHRNAKLKEYQILEIRSRRSESCLALASEYGVSKSLIGQILRGEVWKCLTPS